MPSLPVARAMLSGAPDLTSPTIVVTAPTGGQYITKTTTFKATASDDRGVLGVQWQVDGVNVGAEITTGGTWDKVFDTSTLADGDHTVSAVARDAVGHHTTSLAVTMHVANPSTAAVLLATFNGPGSGGSRRSYGSTGTFGAPNYTNSRRSGSSTWPGNPYSNWGYIVQVQIGWSFDSGGHGFESINGIDGDHNTGLSVGGTQRGSTLKDNTAGHTTAWVTVPDAATGALSMPDWLSDAGGAGGSAFTGDVSVYYRYQ